MKDYSRYARQFILKEIGREGQVRLDNSRVAVVGVGALGSVSANLLARAGVGQLVVIDRDFLEVNNLQRQILFDESDLRADLPKAILAKRKLEAVNSEIKIEAEVTDLNPETIDAVLGRADLVVDGTDNFETRFLLNDYCLKNQIPWIYGGAVSTEGMAYVILPGRGPCLRCLFGEAPSPGTFQTCDQAGILAPVAHLVASFQAMEAIKILAGKWEELERKLLKVDLWKRHLKTISVDLRKDSPCSGCSSRHFPYLESRGADRAVALCGRNAVQIQHPAGEKIDFKSLAERLKNLGEVSFNDYLFRCRVASCEITIFSNGRAIVKGTEDTGQAKSIYAKWIGA